MQATSMQSAPTQGKGAKRRIKLMLAIMLCIIVWACVTAVDQMGKFSEKRKQLEALQGQLSETQKLNDQSKQEIARLNDPEYRQEKIRKELQMAKQGDTVFDVPAKQ